MFRNELGTSVAETMLSLFMVFLVFGSLLPLIQEMHIRLELKKERHAAYETLHEAAKQIVQSDAKAGTRTVNGIIYSWQSEGHCVQYSDYRGEEQRLCVK
ncbi:hypothetical protein [Planococcus dechangensis]|uniref:Type II secretion system protein n=1 Tax=Planococcus dechangensis TaxID=1176255 RepID=A0ABV9MAI7_9BACL